MLTDETKLRVYRYSLYYSLDFPIVKKFPRLKLGQKQIWFDGVTEYR